MYLRYHKIYLSNTQNIIKKCIYTYNICYGNYGVLPEQYELNKNIENIIKIIYQILRYVISYTDLKYIF